MKRWYHQFATMNGLRCWCRRVWRLYVSQLDKRPWLTQAATTGVTTPLILSFRSLWSLICGLGDVIAQQCIEGCVPKGHDWKRSAKMAAIGFCFTGPVLRGWFNLLDRIFGRTVTTRDGLKKMLTDQVLFAPVLFSCLLPLFGLAQGMDKYGIKEKFQKSTACEVYYIVQETSDQISLCKEYFNVLFSCYKVWPAAQMINFYFVPLKFRVNFTNVVSLGWNTYLAWLAHR